MKSAQIKDLQRKIAQLVKDAVRNPSTTKNSITLSRLSKAEADKIKSKTGLTVTGYYRTLDNFSVLHTLKKHGDKEKEATRGQLAVTQTDFEKIPLIVESNNIIYRGKNSAGADVIVYEALIDNKYFYAEEIRVGKKHLVLNAMWKRKK